MLEQSFQTDMTEVSNSDISNSSDSDFNVSSESSTVSIDDEIMQIEMQHSFQDQEEISNPISETVMKTFPIMKIDDSKLDRVEACHICLEKYNLDNYIVIMPCNHFYHEQCLKEWLKKHNTCPICKKDY